MICPRCGAQLQYKAGSTHIKCQYCETEYVLNTDRRAPTGQGIMYNGCEIFYAVLPEGWNVSTFLDYDDVSAKAALCIGTRLRRADAEITIFPVGYFKDAAPEGMDPLILINRRRLRPMRDYAARMIQSTYKGCRILELRELPNELEHISQRLSDMAGSVLGDTEQDAGKFYFKIESRGRMLDGYFATVRAYKAGSMAEPEQDTQEQYETENTRGGTGFPKMTMDQFMRGGLIGMKMRGELPKQRGQRGGTKKPSLGSVGEKLRGMVDPYSWGKYYDVLMCVSATEGCAGYEQIFDNVCTSFTYAPLYFQLQQQEAAAAQNITIQGNMQRQQMQMQASQRLSNTLHQQNDIVMKGWEGRRAAQDRMQTKYSEAVRGVNSYTDVNGNKVEASVRYDHVYQNGSYYAGSDAPVDLGVDWTELKKND